MAEYLVQMNHICKSFPGVKALDDVSFDLKPGEVHALVGGKRSRKVHIDEGTDRCLSGGFR